MQTKKQKVLEGLDGPDESKLEEDWIDKIKTYQVHDPHKDKHILIRLWHDLVFEVNLNFDYYIKSPIRGIFRGIDNLIRYRKIIWQDRWWDYSFMLEMLLFKLKDMEKNWGTNTHYVNDLDEKETLRKLIEDLEWMLDDENYLESNYTDEYKKTSKRFFGRLDRNHQKFWD